MNVYQHEYFIWGTGEDASSIQSCYGRELKQIKILGYIDNDARKEGGNFGGKKVYAPSVLNRHADCGIIIATSKYREEVVEQINREFPRHAVNIAERDFWKRLQILNRYQSSTEPDICEIREYLLCHALTYFNYGWKDRYREEDIAVSFDDGNGLFYIWYNGRKMYISRSYDTEQKVREYIVSILLEQDVKSPHLYLSEQFGVGEQSVVVDAGVAEGNFSLSIIDHVKYIYLFEPDSQWVEALQYTFEPFRDKVSIIGKGISDYTDQGVTTLDAELGDTEINFIKMDIEGEELHALRGAKSLLCKSSDIKCAICTYHQEYAYEAIYSFLQDVGFEIETSRGYMYYPTDDFMGRAPVLRHGIIRAKKENEHQCMTVEI